MPFPDFSIELTYSGHVAGVDEAGCGPLAGPVVAAAVILNPTRLPDGINDSKKLPAAKRESMFDAIHGSSHGCAIGVASVEENDAINILEARKLAMQRAVAALGMTPLVALVDGNRAPSLPCRVQTVVGGDAISLSIAAASIIAKVTRDRMMQQLAREFPGYGWERNAGYGTREHQQALATLGVTPHHRRSFEPVRLLLETLALAV